ncbi:MAG: SDR family NAD(P)-dependent oxidoreductase [Nitrosopumilus sp.]|nr:SDR family NAD(P)-dependent oxidoreductase [Nitrosopumilus sp.]
MNQENKTILVTGSGTGIGQAIARKFAKLGYNIIILGRRKEPLLEASKILNEIIKKEGFDTKVKYYSGVDVADEIGINDLFDNIKSEFGKIDVIVNNAGVSGPVKIFTNSSYSDFKECVSIHLTGTFWTSIKSLEALKADGKIITISTFFTEENKFEQRPYRFRTPYTAAQGAKNRLTEALAWELISKGIKSIGTNPGPVHSDRIYKTVYPKAAAEFLRIGGFKGLTNKQIEYATNALLTYLGEKQDVVEKEVMKVAENITKEGNETNLGLEECKESLLRLLEKVQEIAEKVQKNTKKMIVDNEFLSQEDVAEMVFNLSTDSISKLINGKIIPNDRVFYPVKPIVNNNIDVDFNLSLEGKTLLITSTTDDANTLSIIKRIANITNLAKVKQTIILTHKNESFGKTNEFFKGFHHHSIDFENEDALKRIFNTIETRYGKIYSTIHFTGNYDYNRDLTTIPRNEWDNLVNNFINIPHIITRESALSMATHEALENPNKFKDSLGNIILIGPDSPVGQKIDGKIRARSEIFRGSLRPYVTTTNQELHDVLNSKINLTLILQGSIDGQLPDYEKLESTIMNLCSQKELKNNSILYINE